jgi:hypothetical protein
MAGDGGYFFLLFDFFLPLPITFFMALPTAFSIDFRIVFFFFLAIADSPFAGCRHYGGMAGGGPEGGIKKPGEKAFILLDERGAGLNF